MTAPRAREQANPPSPPDRRPPRRGGGSFPCTYTASAAGPDRAGRFRFTRVTRAAGPRRRLLRSARALAAVACLFLVGSLALPTTVQAQEAETLVSNIGQGSKTTSEFSLQAAQRFTTGSYEHGYTLSTVDVVSVDAEGTSFEAKVCTVDGDDHPTSTCWNLGAPGIADAFAAGTITFDAPLSTVLETETTYTVVLTPFSVGGVEVTFGLTTANGEDAGKASGWSIADTYESWGTSLSPPDWVTSGSGRSFRIAIKGSEAPEPETTENQPGEIRAYWNVPGHFGGNRMAGCAGTVPFRAFWERPKRADEWEAEVEAEYGASNATHSTIEDIGDGFHELTGTVHIRDGEFGVVSIRVRGRFGDDGWGAWSRPTELFCVSSAQRALQGRFVSPPERHDGEKRIKVRVEFSEAPENVGADGVEVEGGEVTSVRSVGGNAPGGAGTRSNSRSIGNRNAGRQDGEVVWEFEIEPDSDGDVTVSIEAGRPCDEEGAICTADGRSLSEGISTTVEGPDEGPPPLTASFVDVPSEHDGESAFRFRVAFSEPLSWMNGRRLREDVVAVAGGRATAAGRVERRRDLWQVTVEPDSGADVTVTLAAGAACRTPAAVCTSDGRALSATISATVAGPAVETGPAPLTASFEDVPAEHDGESAFTLRLAFTEPLSWMNGRRLREDVVAVSGGRATAAGRVDRRRDLWQVTVEPDSGADVTVTLSSGAACGTPAAVCTSDGRALTNTISTTVRGPVTVSVADARAEEGADETIDFAVSLSRAASRPVRVAYATADGTARAGADYTRTRGTLKFAPGETLKTVRVPVLDDAHDEGEETLTLRLSKASRARLADRVATGTIENADHLQRAWLARFGRTAATHVTDAVSDRLRGTPGQGSHLTVGGYRLPVGQRDADGAEPATQADSLASLMTGLAGVLGLGPGQAGGTGVDPGGGGLGGASWPDAGRDPRLGQSQSVNLDLRRLLLGSSFRLSLGAAATGSAGPRLTAWGRVAGTTFDGRDGIDGRDGTLSLNGDVLTGTVGVDGEWDRLLAGLAVAHSRGNGSYTDATPDMDARGRGDLEQTLTSVHPYLRYAVTDRLAVWGLLGFGTGQLELEVANGESRETDTDLLMGAFGGRGILLAAAESGGFQLATRTDAMLTRTTSDAVAGMASGDAEAHRLRLVLEGSRGFTWAEGRSLTPTMEVGLRHDWGDAETGFGLELGGRVQYVDPALGLTIDAAVRGLLAHEDSDYQEWGASGTVRVAPGAMGQGLSLTLAPAWGATASGVDGLWSRQTTAGLAPQGNRAAPVGRLNAEVGYGFAPFGTGLLTPYAGTVLSDGAARTYRVGGRLQLGGPGATGLNLNLEGMRQEPAGQQPVNQGLRLQITWGF